MDSGDDYSLCTDQPEPKPSLTAYNLLGQKITGSVVKEDEGVYRAEGSGGRTVYVVWGSGTVDLSDALGDEVTVTDVSGNVTTADGDAVPLSDAPVFVEAAGQD